MPNNSASSLAEPRFRILTLLFSPPVYYKEKEIGKIFLNLNLFGARKTLKESYPQEEPMKVLL